MTLHDPHSSDEPYYECLDCGVRYTTDEHGRLCPECGGYLKNIAVPRQE